MGSFIDETGSRFGNLTVLGYVDDPRPGAFWHISKIHNYRRI